MVLNYLLLFATRYTLYDINMTPLIYFIFYLVVLSVSYRLGLAVSYGISILFSLFIIFTGHKEPVYAKSMFVILLNALPLVSELFKKEFYNCKNKLREEMDEVKTNYNNLSAQEKAQLEANIEKERRMEHTLSLYEISKEMSGCITFEDIFGIFASMLKKSFRFKLIKLILIKKEPDNTIENVYKIKIGDIPSREAPDDFDKEVVNIFLENKNNVIIYSGQEPVSLKRLSIIRDFETLLALPLMAEGEIRGVLFIENLPKIYFDNFLILAGQFSIQLQKVILYEKVQEMSITDSLTEISTRRYFLARFKEELHRSMRRKANLAILMLDIDHFKEKNDKYGHLVGDVILKEAANLLKANLREIDIAARYGGEEFCIVLSGSDRTGAEQVAERLRKSMENAIFKAYDEKVRITISIGISVFPQDGVNETSLIESADKALYKAKSEGRNRVC